MRLAVQLYRIAVLLGPDDRLPVCPLTEHYLARSRVAFFLTEAYALKAPALTGVFYCFNRLTNPINQPSIPGTKYCLRLLIKLIVPHGTPAEG